ncbi:hypothetical protein K502DRAFT_326418 [Neoconidiobolus thromboides FSU 785]|nr:hypothetical protein K502DRAFT_326418 [Neoconidiobolus thromboides FSU 785]
MNDQQNIGSLGQGNITLKVHYKKKIYYLLTNVSETILNSKLHLNTMLKFSIEKDQSLQHSEEISLEDNNGIENGNERDREIEWKFNLYKKQENDGTEQVEWLLLQEDKTWSYYNILDNEQVFLARIIDGNVEDIIIELPKLINYESTDSEDEK